MSESKTIDLPVLETRCAECDGCGVVRPCGDTERCPLCGGTGYELTAAGEVIVALMERRFRRFAREIVDTR